MPSRLRKPTLAPDAHLKPRLNPFGAKQMPVLAGAVSHGGDVQVYESTGGHPGIWVKAEADGRDALVLLDLPNARRLAEQLIYLHEHHYTKEN